MSKDIKIYNMDELIKESIEVYVFMSTKPVEAGSLKVGAYVVIDGEPCKIVSVERSKPGKHGSAKVRIVAIGIFDGVKRNLVSPADARVEAPVVEKIPAQVIALLPDYIQLMLMTTYETIEVPYPEDEELKNKLTEGREVEVWKIMDRYKIMRAL